MSNGVRTLFPLPPEVNDFFNAAYEHVGEFCREAVLSHMFNNSIQMFNLSDPYASDISGIAAVMDDLIDGGVLDDSLGFSPFSSGMLYASGMPAQEALNDVVIRYMLNPDLEASNLRILNNESFVCTIKGKD